MATKYNFTDRDANGCRVPTARNSYAICWAWNEATRPDVARTSHEHKRAAQFARALMRRVPAYAYREWSDGRWLAIIMVEAPRRRLSLFGGALMASLRCPSCQLARINGVVCHETGCPDSHLFVTRDCKFCGSTFSPEERDSRFCSPCCGATYNGGSCDCESGETFRLETETAGDL